MTNGMEGTTHSILTIGRNLALYLIGVAFAVGGALGLIDVIQPSGVIAGISFVAGVLIVLAVHEYLDGPI